MPFCANRHAFISTVLMVSCLPLATSTSTQWQATHALSLLDPCLPEASIPVFTGTRHLVLRQYDQENEAATQHFAAYVSEGLDFIRDAFLDRANSRLLVHCHAGASRSTAFALGAICLLAPELDAESAMKHLLAIVNKPWPNRRIVEEIDANLKKQGLLVRALDGYRARYPRRILAYRALNKKRGLHSPVKR